MPESGADPLTSSLSRMFFSAVGATHCSKASSCFSAVLSFQWVHLGRGACFRSSASSSSASGGGAAGDGGRAAVAAATRQQANRIIRRAGARWARAATTGRGFLGFGRYLHDQAVL